MKEMLNSIVVTLDLTGERIRRFHKSNMHLSENPPEVLPGVDGSALSMSQLVEDGLVTPELATWGGCTAGTLGVAASMRWIWQQIAGLPSGALVMEDDAQTHPQILSYIASNINELEATDITFFGYNSDAPLSIQTSEGAILSMLTEPRYPSGEWIQDALSKTSTKEVKLIKYLKGFGMMCYWMSPKGARKIENTCFPLTLDTCKVPLLPHAMPGTSIDRRLCALYPLLEAKITWPPLAYSENRDSSTR